MTVSPATCRIIDIFPDYNQIVLLDVETTGLTTEADQIIELAATRYYNSGAAGTAEFEEKKSDILVKLPKGERLPQNITELTHITDEMLETEGVEEIDAAELFANVFLPAEKTIVVAHNAQFDLSFVLKMLEKYGKSIPVSFDILDTFTVLKDRKAHPHSLKDAIEYYQIKGVENTHRAVDDVKALSEVVKHMKEEKDDVEDYINLIGVHRVHGLWGEKITGVAYCIQLLGEKRKRLPDFLKEGKRIYTPEKIKGTQPLVFKE
ncbi:MAG: 3'-5' exonuclease [Methanimicrococcus sp.]|nr:3'-5' exonuclease [Methanimicrococcus sp.]